MKNTFKPGDRVRVVSTRYPMNVPTWSLGTVRERYLPGEALGVAIDHSPLGDGSGCWTFYPDELAHVREGRVARTLRAIREALR